MASSSVSLIIPLSDAQRSRKAGIPAVNLSRLHAARFAVPRGFVISADACSFHLWTSGVRAASLDSPESRQAARDAIIASVIPEDIWKGIADAYHRLSLQVGFTDPKVELCASPIEDDPQVAEAVPVVASGLDALSQATRQVWASAIDQEHSGEPTLAVMVRQLIEGPAKGAACTADPSTGDPRVVAVTCRNGGDPARFRIDLREVRIVEREGELPDGLTDSAIVRLAEQAVLAEGVVCSPIQIEWTYEGDSFWITRAGKLDNSLSCERPSDARMVSSRPVSQLARALLWSAPNSEQAGAFLENGYVFSGHTDLPTELRGWESSAEKDLDRWHKETRPELTSGAAKIISTDLAADQTSLPNLLTTAASLSAKAVDWLGRMRGPCAKYPELLREAVGEDRIVTTLLAGLECPSFMRDARLQEMGDVLAAAESAGKIDDEAWWRTYKGSVKSFAAEYGCSFTDLGDMFDPACRLSWVENLDVVFRIIAALAVRGGGPSLVTLHCAAQDEAAGVEKQVISRLKPSDRARFTKLVRVARAWLCARDECEHALALSYTALRLAALELGRRLCESKVIAVTEDVFSLSIDELKSIPQEPTDDERSDLIALIAARKHDLWLEERVAGQESQAELAEPRDTLRGQAVVPGKASGRVKIARSIAEAGEIEAGDILVVESFGPAWTPFLGVAGGLVSESEAGWQTVPAVAVDYGVPIIAGCRGAMSIVADGQRITIDGSNGTLTL